MHAVVVSMWLIQCAFLNFRFGNDCSIHVIYGIFLIESLIFKRFVTKADEIQKLHLIHYQVINSDKSNEMNKKCH